ncbi:MAG: CpsD/CapB family tyrosine-protein kinase [Bacteroidota bacterium]
MGLILGFGVVFLRRYLKSKVFDSASIENQIDLPVLAELRSLPEDVNRISQDVINLATNIHLVQEVSMITVGAYDPGSGKRKAALNLAKAMAAIGYRTILVDADLYDSRLHQYLNRGNDRGLSQVLMGQSTLKSAIQVTDLPHLDLLAAGRFSEEIPTRLILHPSTQEVFQTLRKQYDRVIIAVPDLRDVRDAIPLMKASEVNLLTAWTDKTSMRDLAASEELLRKFQVPNLYCLLIRTTSQGNQSTYSVNVGTLAPIGQGIRRAALKRWLKRKMGRNE